MSRGLPLLRRTLHMRSDPCSRSSQMDMRHRPWPRRYRGRPRHSHSPSKHWSPVTSMCLLHKRCTLPTCHRRPQCPEDTQYTSSRVMHSRDRQDTASHLTHRCIQKSLYCVAVHTSVRLCVRATMRYEPATNPPHSFDLNLIPLGSRVVLRGPVDQPEDHGSHTAGPSPIPVSTYTATGFLGSGYEEVPDPKLARAGT